MLVRLAPLPWNTLAKRSPLPSRAAMVLAVAAAAAASPLNKEALAALVALAANVAVAALCACHVKGLRGRWTGGDSWKAQAAVDRLGADERVAAREVGLSGQAVVDSGHGAVGVSIGRSYRGGVAGHASSGFGGVWLL